MSVALSSDRAIDFTLVTEDLPMDRRRSLHRHECYQLRIRIPQDNALPISVEVICPQVCHHTLKVKDYGRYYIWLLDKDRPDFSYPHSIGTFSSEYIPVLTAALDRLRAVDADDREAREDCRMHLRCMVQQYMKPVIYDLKHDTKVQWVVRRFQNHYYRRELAISREAISADLSPNHIQKLFIAETHQTPKAFLTRVRMAMAAKFLKEHRYTVEQISVMCGFKTSAYFSDAFRRYYGCSPVNFAKKTANDTVPAIASLP